MLIGVHPSGRRIEITRNQHGFFDWAVRRKDGGYMKGDWQPSLSAAKREARFEAFTAIEILDGTSKGRWK